MKATLTSVPGVAFATIDSLTSDGRLMVRLAGGNPELRCARALWSPDGPDWSQCVGARVVVAFVDGDEAQPVLLGILDPPGDDTVGVAKEAPPAGEVEATTMPKVLRIECSEELILECGEARISMRADGRIVILGGYLLSRSRGVNKIKGGSVQIN